MPPTRHNGRLRRAFTRLADRSRMSPYVVLAVSLVATALATAYVWTSAESRDRLRFEKRVDETATALDRRLDAYIDILIGVRGFFAASDHVSAEEFEQYVASLRVQERYPGVQGIGFSARVPVAARDSLVRARRSAGRPAFRTWPEPRGDELHAIVYLLPRDERNEAAMGFDMASEPVRREAMERARDTGRPAASGRVTLVQEIDEDVQPGFLIYVPVYQGPEVPGSVAERRARLRGFVYSPFRAGDLLGGISESEAPVELRVYDGRRDDPDALLFDTRVARGADSAHAPRFHGTVSLEVAGRPWTVAVDSGPAFEASSNRRFASLALVLGLLVSGVLSVLTAAEARAHERAEQTARALQASESQYRMAFEGNPQPMWVYDVETLAFLASNDAAVRHYGYSAEEFRGMTVRDLRPPEDLPRLEAHLARRPGQRENPAVWRHVKRDGSVMHVEISSEAIDFGGRPARLVLAHDVTEKVRSRAELEEAQRRLRRILSMSTAVIYTMEPRGEELVLGWVTDNLPRVSGYGVDEGLAPGWWHRHIHPDEQDAVMATAAQLLERGQRTVEYRFRHASGRYIWIRDDAVVRFDGEGRPEEVIGSWVDVTERRHLEEQLQQAQKMEAVGRLAGGIAHDFNNILTVIRSQSDLLLLDLPPGPVSSEVELIQQSADRAAKLTSQLLAFSRNQVLRPQVVDPRRTILEMGALLDRVLGEDVALAYDLPDDVPVIEVDPGPFEQALMNLAVNARDVMPRGGTLTFSARVERVGRAEGEGWAGLEPGRYAVLRVTDTGTGMTADVRSRVFEPFFTTKPKDKGTGLGLAMVYGFMRQSHGTVSVESEPGRGSTFSLYFPAAEGRLAGEVPAPSDESGALRTSGTVLLIEDDESVRRATRKILERSGLTVVDVETAEAGLEALEAGTCYDLALTDLVLPGMSGREFVEIVRGRAPEFPLILMSGYEEVSSTPRPDLPVEVTFVPKPFTADALLAAVRRALRS